MTWLSASDPQALLAMQAGVVQPPTGGTGAANDPMATDQRAASLGQPAPVVFGRWRNGAGGVFISPPATDCRFENDPTNAVTAYYHLLLSDGDIDSIQVRDVFQGPDRVGSFSQSYNRRAGTWDPGNALVQRGALPLPAATYYCGSVGTYPGMSTLSFQATAAVDSDTWKRQVHVFIRGGLNVTRLADNVTGPSDNYCDLIRWLMQRTARIPDSMIDTAALTQSAGFLEAQGFTCNTVISEPSSLADYIARTAPYFLLTESRVNGRLGLRPVLPTTATGEISTAVGPAYVFTVDDVLPGTLEINYATLASRQPFVVQVTWRQQSPNELGIARVLEMRYAGTAENGPYESHDLSAFCTSETHAARIAAYILSRRCRVTHTARWTARPGLHGTSLLTGTIVRVKLPRESSSDAAAEWDHLYQIERVTKTLAGDIAYEASHVPVNDDSDSLIALDVVAATGTGIVLPSQRTGINQDTNSSTDSSVPPDTGIDPTDPRADDASGGGAGQALDGPLDGESADAGGAPDLVEDTSNGVLYAGSTGSVPKCSNGSNAQKNYRWYDGRTGKDYVPDEPFFSLTSSELGSYMRLAIYYTCPPGEYPPNPDRATTDVTYNPGDLLPNGQTAASTQNYKAGDPYPWGVVQTSPATPTSTGAPPAGYRLLYDTVFSVFRKDNGQGGPAAQGYSYDFPADHRLIGGNDVGRLRSQAGVYESIVSVSTTSIFYLTVKTLGVYYKSNVNGAITLAYMMDDYRK